MSKATLRAEVRCLLTTHECNKAPGRTRTDDLRFTKPALLPAELLRHAGGERIGLSPRGFGDLAVPSTPPISTSPPRVHKNEEAGDLWSPSLWKDKVLKSSSRSWAGLYRRGTGSLCLGSGSNRGARGQTTNRSCGPLRLLATSSVPTETLSVPLQS